MVLVSDPHAPSETLAMLAAGRWHCATESSHAFEYVLPSEPQIGLKSAVHICGHSRPDVAAGVGVPAAVLGTGTGVGDDGRVCEPGTGADDGVCAGGAGVLPLSLELEPHSPSAAFVSLLCGRSHCATESAHAFEYVLPSEPQIGV